LNAPNHAVKSYKVTTKSLLGILPEPIKHNGSSELQLTPVSVALSKLEHSPGRDAAPSQYLPNYYWYPFILLGEAIQVGLSVLLEDTEYDQAEIQTRNLLLRNTAIWYYTTAPLVTLLCQSA
jgi:hypothetical protein